jgi:hypothetical protein
MTGARKRRTGFGEFVQTAVDSVIAPDPTHDEPPKAVGEGDWSNWGMRGLLIWILGTGLAAAGAVCLVLARSCGH